MFSLESPQRGDSNEYTHYTIFHYKKNIPKLSQICNYGICSKGLQKEFETAVVNEPSVFEPLKFYCSCLYSDKQVGVTEIRMSPVSTPYLYHKTAIIKNDLKGFFFQKMSEHVLVIFASRRSNLKTPKIGHQFLERLLIYIFFF